MKSEAYEQYGPIPFPLLLFTSESRLELKLLGGWAGVCNTGR